MEAEGGVSYLNIRDVKIKTSWGPGRPRQRVVFPQLKYFKEECEYYTEGLHDGLAIFLPVS